MSWWKAAQSEDKPVEDAGPPIVIREFTEDQALCATIVCGLIPLVALLAYFLFIRLGVIADGLIFAWPITAIWPIYISYTSFHDYRTIRKTGKPLLLTPEFMAERERHTERYSLRCGMALLLVFALIFVGISLKRPLPLPIWLLIALVEGGGWFGIRHGWRKLNASDAKQLRELAGKAVSENAVTASGETANTPKHWWTDAARAEQQVGRK